jgi:hypothetical protein
MVRALPRQHDDLSREAALAVRPLDINQPPFT